MPRYHFPGMRRCSNCKFARLAAGTGGSFECRRNPPQLVAVSERAAQTAFPLVGPDLWCGHHAFAPLRRLEEQKKSDAAASPSPDLLAAVLAWVRTYAADPDCSVSFPRLVSEFVPVGVGQPSAEQLVACLKHLEASGLIVGRHGEDEPTLYFAAARPFENRAHGRD
jgi:hypothetical protein